MLRSIVAELPGAGEAERGRRHIVRVGGRAHRVEILGDIGRAGVLARQGQRELGRELTGHLAEHGVERGLGRREVAAARARPSR